MYHKEDKKSIREPLGRIIPLLSAIITFAAGPLIYCLALREHASAQAEEAGEALLMYSMPHLWCVIALGLICGAAVFALCSYILKPMASEYALPEEAEEIYTDEASPAPAFSEDPSLREEYPELFIGGEKEEEEEEEEKEEKTGFSHDIASYFEKNDTEEAEEASADTDAESEADRALREFIGEEKKEDTEDLYASLSSRVPEGYEMHTEAEESTPEAEETEKKAAPVSASPLPLIIVSLVILLISAGVGLAMSFNYSALYGDTVKVSTLFYKKAYTAEEVAVYTVSSALNGDIKLSATMTDGREIQLAPASYYRTEEYGKSYTDDFDYLLELIEGLDRAGAEKTVSDRASIESYYKNEDGTLPDYIIKITEE